jgi:hypothetical protein
MENKTFSPTANSVGMALSGGRGGTGSTARPWSITPSSLKVKTHSTKHVLKLKAEQPLANSTQPNGGFKLRI